MVHCFDFRTYEMTPVMNRSASGVCSCFVVLYHLEMIVSRLHLDCSGVYDMRCRYSYGVIVKWTRR